MAKDNGNEPTTKRLVADISVEHFEKFQKIKGDRRCFHSVVMEDAIDLLFEQHEKSKAPTSG